VSQSCYLALFSTQLAFLVLWTLRHTEKQFGVASAALALVSVPFLAFLSLIEYYRTERSSDGINIYLFFSVLFDAIQTRSLWLLSDRPLAVAASVGVSLKCILLWSEMQSKQSSILQDSTKLSPESLSGVFSRRLFWWLNGVLYRGYRGRMDLDSLPYLGWNSKSAILLSQSNVNNKSSS